ncbi:MAG: hypothetical protein ACRDRX_15280, partial [Pseudonocardiaceae bacterium]
PEHALYDRTIATFGIRLIPPAWIDQTRTGGIILAPVCSGLAAPTVTDPGTAQGPFIGTGYFMRHRTVPHESPTGHSVATADGPCWPSRTADLPSSAYYDNDFRFFLDVTIPGLAHGYRDGDPHNLTITPMNCSCAGAKLADGKDARHG